MTCGRDGPSLHAAADGEKISTVCDTRPPATMTLDSYYGYLLGNKRNYCSKNTSISLVSAFSTRPQECQCLLWAMSGILVQVSDTLNIDKDKVKIMFWHHIDRDHHHVEDVRPVSAAGGHDVGLVEQDHAVPDEVVGQPFKKNSL